jgi:putative membrane protein
MKTRHLALGLATLSLLAAAACGSSDQNTQPQTPTDVTATTSGTGPSAPYGNAQNAVTPMNSTPTPAEEAPTTAPRTDQATGGTSPGGMATMADGTMGTVVAGGNAGSNGASDAQIAAVLDAANNGEIEQARVAAKKSKNARVKHFAQHMIDDHSHAEAKLQATDSKAGITPQDSALSSQLKDGGRQVMTTLGSTTGADFDRAYMDAQVDQHQKVLDAIDRFIPQAQNADLKSILQECRTKVAGHLRDAKDIQSQLTSK